MKNKILYPIVAALLALSSFLLGHTNTVLPLGNIAPGSELHSTTTNIATAWQNPQVIREGTDWTATATTAPGVLGSLIITQTGTSPFCLYDATSTKTNGEWATTTIACFPASATVGNYPFNVQIRKGILIYFSGAPTTATQASTTITYRLNNI